MDRYNKKVLKYLKKTLKNRLTIAIIYTTLQHFSIIYMVLNILLDKTFRMRGHSLLSNNVKFIIIWFE